ncbi:MULTISPECIES: hypothetical protein [Crateriforma]|uniref:Uncharacterized protein n=1 Tax=Crateriforma conspicua TaxID=2527996 RepID=A0A5C6FTN3_9PLAN|nr:MULTISPECIES: hypothetical protein [Crateriforma]QDV64255.1 hypothetical protein Mal65_34070 [Crateriforma conspicua]TWT69647.1 hypothetical protein Pan14r_19370 [Crateriforma conspicua]TWU66367.1 hypothetical protein V7x_19320 [Crateriforma conspicua]
MAKYYVQCGSVRVVLDAENVSQAACGALDRVLGPQAWVYDDDGMTEEDCRVHLMLEALLQLETTVQISEQGFDRDDALRVGTPETVECWHRWMVCLRRLYDAAGLDGRPFSVATLPHHR